MSKVFVVIETDGHKDVNRTYFSSREEAERFQKTIAPLFGEYYLLINYYEVYHNVEEAIEEYKN